ncbi:MAG: Flp pilus assembly protein TadD, partial [Myxococcota bacterium]
MRAITILTVGISLLLAGPAAAQTDVDALVGAALAAKNAGKFEAAIKTLETALAMSPKNEKVLIALGRTHGANRQLDKAAAYL